MVLKLTAEAAILCVVAAVVGPWGHFVQEDAAVRKQEHFNTAGEIKAGREAHAGIRVRLGQDMMVHCIARTDTSEV